ncbi:hypothetical protein [Bacillus toyonensis]|uniref:hypothetical protein n=1 Tax=Bacillus toyonensis TaxID=155322 RepID=UPI000BF23B17|nr:hypothetical protein [Bacillus toyonensis]PEI69765.1 hypothetical protein CN674_22145 [Bacillus toyonensis]
MKRKLEVEEDNVIIDGFEIGGWFVRDYCKNCGHEIILYEDYDSKFCPECNEWTVSCCGDEDCMFCKDRPAKPLPE